MVYTDAEMVRMAALTRMLSSFMGISRVSCPDHIGHLENIAALTKAILEFSLASLRFFWQAATAALVQMETIFSRVNSQRHQCLSLIHVNGCQ